MVNVEVMTLLDAIRYRFEVRAVLLGVPLVCASVPNVVTVLAVIRSAQITSRDSKKPSPEAGGAER